MDIITISSLLLGVYAFALAALTLRTYITSNNAEYVIGARNLGLFPTICSMLAGQYNGGGVFFFFTFGILFGYGLLWFGLGFVVGYLVLSLFAKIVHEEGVTYNDINVPDIINRRCLLYTSPSPRDRG